MTIATNFKCPKCEESLELAIGENEYVCGSCGESFDAAEWEGKLKTRTAGEKRKAKTEKKAEPTKHKISTCRICDRADIAIVAKGRCSSCYPLHADDDKARAYRLSHPVGSRAAAQKDRNAIAYTVPPKKQPGRYVPDTQKPIEQVLLDKLIAERDALTHVIEAIQQYIAIGEPPCPE